MPGASVTACARSRRRPRCSRLLEGLYGRRPLPFQTLNFRKGTQQAPHSDALHFSTMPAGFMAGVWVALEDMDMDNGPLVFYPGSHRLPEVTMEELGFQASKKEYSHYEEYVQKLIEREGFEPVYGTVSKGQAIMWASNLLHGGSPQTETRAVAPQPGDALFLRGLPLLDADAERGRERAVEGSRVDQGGGVDDATSMRGPERGL